jgi:hypothetical protein
MVKIKDISSKVRQIAVTGIGRDEPTLLITHDLATPARDLFARYAERMMVKTSWTPTSAGSTWTPSPAASRSTWTWTRR